MPLLQRLDEEFPASLPSAAAQAEFNPPALRQDEHRSKASSLFHTAAWPSAGSVDVTQTASEFICFLL